MAMRTVSMNGIGRRAALRCLVLGLVGAPAALRGRFRMFPDSTVKYSARAVRLMQEATVVDLLNQFRFPDYSQKRPWPWSEYPWFDRWLHQPGAFTKADAAIFQESGINAFALGAAVPDFSVGLRYFADWNGFCAEYSDWVLRIDDVTSFERAKRTGKIGLMLTFQDSLHFGEPADVDTFWAMGQRISQLTYNFNNRIGSGFLEQRDGGLSVFGLSILKRMQEVGMGVDLSHCGDQTTLDALEAATRPVLFTHATCRALAPGLLRAKTDDAIRRLAKSGGLMGIPFIRFQVRDTEPVTIEHVLDHFDHVSKLVGVEHLAVGSDLDAIGHTLPIGSVVQLDKQPNFERYHYHEDAEGKISIKGLDHPKRMFDLTEGLIQRGYSDADIKSILGGNAVRVLGEIWAPKGSLA
jgi:membrane dipeptidase